MRLTVLILVTLVAFSAVFDLDIVLGSFAAGFVLRYIIPEGNHTLETKLDGLAYGFLIPVFFTVSGAKIDLTAVASRPGLLVGFIVALLIIRAVPILISMSICPATRDVSAYGRITVALYCTTALPIIVAVTSVAVNAGALSQDIASVMVAAGGGIARMAHVGAKPLVNLVGNQGGPGEIKGPRLAERLRGAKTFLRGTFRCDRNAGYAAHQREMVSVHGIFRSGHAVGHFQI